MKSVVLSVNCGQKNKFKDCSGHRFSASTVKKLRRVPSVSAEQYANETC